MFNKKIVLIVITLLLAFISTFYFKCFRKEHVEDPVNIVFTIDNNYVLYAGFAMNSMFKNTDSKIHFYIIEDGLKRHNKLFLKTFAKIHGCDVDFIYKSMDEYNNIEGKLFEDAYLTSIAMARLYTPELLPETVSKVVYLDVDILVLGDIRNLYNKDLHGKTVAMAKHIHPRHYYNNGVVVMDLDKMRKNSITRKFVKFYKEEVSKDRKKYRYPDQDCFNNVLRGDIWELSQNWNMTGSYEGVTLNRDNVSNVICLFHFYTGFKPFNYISTAIGHEMYSRYWDRSIFVVLKPFWYCSYVVKTLRSKGVEKEMRVKFIYNKTSNFKKFIKRFKAKRNIGKEFIFDRKGVLNN